MILSYGIRIFPVMQYYLPPMNAKNFIQVWFLENRDFYQLARDFHSGGHRFITISSPLYRRFILISSLILLGFFTSLSWANPLDSLRNVIQNNQNPQEVFTCANEVSIYYSFSEVDSGLKYAEVAVQSALHTKDDSLICLGLNALGAVLMIHRRYQEIIDRFNQEDKKEYPKSVKPFIWLMLHRGYNGLSLREESRRYIEMALQQSEDAGFSFVRSSVLLEAASFYKESGDFSSAIYTYYQAQEMVTPPDERGLSAAINQHLAGIYEVIGDYEQSMKLVTSELEAARQREDDYWIMYNLYSLGEVQYKLQAYSEALASAREAIQVSNRSHITNSIGYAYFQIARVYAEWESFDSAMHYVEEGIRVCQARNDLREETDCQMMKARIFLLTGEYERADSLAKEILKIEVYEQLKFDLYEIVAEANEKMGRFPAAHLFMKLEKKLRDSLEQIDPVFKLTAAVFEREYEQEKERQRLQYDGEVNKWKKLALLIGGTLAIVGFLLFAFYRSYILSIQNSELNKLNRTLEQRNQALRQFTFISSHDLLEPVRVINSMSSLLHRSIGKGDSPKNIERLSYILSSAKSLKVMTAGVREFTDLLNAEQPAETFPATDISVKVNEWIAPNPSVNTANITWDLMNSQIVFPFHQLADVFQKLIRNSRQANPDSSLEIMISGRNSSGEYLFAVKDNGVGINPAYREKVFEPFQSLENKMESQRSGLGLSICRLIVENNGGRIWLESKEEMGVTVFFTVPLG